MQRTFWWWLAYRFAPMISKIIYVDFFTIFSPSDSRGHSSFSFSENTDSDCSFYGLGLFLFITLLDRLLVFLSSSLDIRTLGRGFMELLLLYHMYVCVCT